MELSLTFEEHPIRIVGTKDSPEWIAADVCKVLGIKNAADSLAQLDGDEKGIANIYTPGGDQEMLTVTEPGLYQLVSRSRKAVGKRFRRWLFHDVIPSIRQHGCYPPPAVTTGNGNAIVQLDPHEFCREMGKTIHDACFEAVKPVADKVDRIEEKVDDLGHRLANVERRRKIPDETRRRHQYIVKQYYRGACPCCRHELIVNSAGEKLATCQFDHWDRPSEVALSKTWAVCSKCNQTLRDADFKKEKESQFDAYQQCRRDFQLAVDGPFLPGLEDNQ